VKETKQLRNLMESLDKEVDLPNDKKENCSNCGDPYNKDGVCTNCGDKALNEDDDDIYAGQGWSGSDWYQPLKNMDEYIDKHGLSPDSIMQAANNEAEFYSRPMGYGGDWTAGALALKDAWIRMTDRGQKLQRMFATKESVHEAGDNGELTWGFNVDFEDVELSYKGKTIAVMSMDDWDGLVNQARRVHSKRQ